MDYENLTPQYRIEEYLEAIVEGWVDATVVAYPDYPSWRLEEFLDAFITYIWEDGDHPRRPCPDPVWRLEECLRAIYDVMTGAATPWAFPLPPTNRIEEYLAAIHAYLADNTELPVPEPVWRIEQWLAYALDAVKQGGGIVTTVSGTMVHITNALAKAALSVLVNITPIQSGPGDPAPDNVRPISGRTGLSVYVSPTQDPDDATTYAVDWTTSAGTVYGGTVDVVTGVLTVDKICVNLSPSWYWFVGNTQPSGLTVCTTTNFPSHVAGGEICSHYTRATTPYIVDLKLGEFITSGTGAYFCFKGQSGGTADEFKAYLTAQENAGTPVQLVYELATPLTYQLTAQEVQMLLGENYVWSSSGDTVSVTYYAEGNANPLQSLNILLGGNYSNPKTADDVSDKEALEIILGGNK